MKKRLAGRKYTNRLAWSVWKIARNNKLRAATGKICRYFFSFAGDGMITTARRWNPDAVDASFEILFYNDVSVALDTTIFQQSALNNVSLTELRINTLPSGAIRLTKGGASISILTSSAPELGIGNWSIKYNASTGDNTISKYNTVTDVYDVINTINRATGTAREPAAGIVIANNLDGSHPDIGVMSDVKFFIDGDRSTGTLVLDMPINDNSTIIKDNSATAINGTLTTGTGSWFEVCEGDSDWIDSDGWIDSEEWVD